jgi:hypothetical protein
MLFRMGLNRGKYKVGWRLYFTPFSWLACLEFFIDNTKIRKINGIKK